MKGPANFQGEIITKLHWQILKIFFSRTTGPISTKLGTNHLWGKGIQVCTNEGPCPFPREDNYHIAKIHWKILKIFFSRTTRPISTKLGTNDLWVKGIQVCSYEGSRLFPKGDNYQIAKIHWLNFLKNSVSRTNGPTST